MFTDCSLSPMCLHALSIEDLVMRCVASHLARRSIGAQPEKVQSVRTISSEGNWAANTMRNPSTRRSFLSAGATFIAAGRAGLAQTGELTARQVIERIQKNAGVPWRE